MISYGKYSFLIVTILRVFLGAVILYVVLCFFLYLYQDQLLYYPKALDENRSEQLRALHPYVEEILMTMDDGITIHGWRVDGNSEVEGGAAGTVLYYGGNAEEVSWMIEEALRFPKWTFVLMNYRGYGLSGGSPGEKQLFQDAIQVYDELAARKCIDPSNTIIMGRSLGTGVGIYLAAHRPVSGAVLISPYDSMIKVAQDTYFFLPVKYLLKDKFQVVKWAPGLTIPLHAFIAMDDQIIRTERSFRLLDFWGGEVYLTKAADVGHNDLVHSPSYREFVTSSLQQLEDRLNNHQIW